MHAHTNVNAELRRTMNRIQASRAAAMAQAQRHGTVPYYHVDPGLGAFLQRMGAQLNNTGVQSSPPTNVLIRARVRARDQNRAWRQAHSNNIGLHGLFINTKLVKLPTNKPIDPISHHTFKKGDVATRIRQNGKNTYFRTGSFNNWFGHNWKHMNANSNAKISYKQHPLTRVNVTRKNVSRVKFV
jgi:hypothetical protein